VTACVVVNASNSPQRKTRRLNSGDALHIRASHWRFTLDLTSDRSDYQINSVPPAG
jgi:hypothetical protein